MSAIATNNGILVAVAVRMYAYGLPSILLIRLMSPKSNVDLYSYLTIAHAQAS